MTNFNFMKNEDHLNVRDAVIPSWNGAAPQDVLHSLLDILSQVGRSTVMESEDSPGSSLDSFHFVSTQTS